MQIHHLGNIALMGYGSVLPDNSSIKKNKNCFTKDFRETSTVLRFCSKDSVILDYHSEMTVLILYPENAPVQTFYLDRCIVLNPGVLFSVAPMEEACTVDFFLTQDHFLTPLDIVRYEPLSDCTPLLIFNRIYTFFYQESSGNFRFRGECHNTYELVYVDRGCLCNTINGSAYQLKQQNLLLIDRKSLHIQSSDRPVSFLTLSFSLKNDLPPWILNRIFPCSPRIMTIIEQMLFEREAHSLYGYDNIEALLRLLLVQLIRFAVPASTPIRDTLSSLPATSCTEHKIADSAVQIISKRIHEKITLKQIAGAVHISESYLHHIFIRHIGLPPGKYITKVRLEECKMLLRQGELSIGDVSKTMGFSSPQLFSKQFRRQFGITPSEYVRSLR